MTCKPTIPLPQPLRKSTATIWLSCLRKNSWHRRRRSHWMAFIRPRQRSWFSRMRLKSSSHERPFKPWMPNIQPWVAASHYLIQRFRWESILSSSSRRRSTTELMCSNTLIWSSSLVSSKSSWRSSATEALKSRHWHQVPVLSSRRKILTRRSKDSAARS